MWDITKIKKDNYKITKQELLFLKKTTTKNRQTRLVKPFLIGQTIRENSELVVGFDEQNN